MSEERKFAMNDLCIFRFPLQPSPQPDFANCVVQVVPESFADIGL